MYWEAFLRFTFLFLFFFHCLLEGLGHCCLACDEALLLRLFWRFWMILNKYCLEWFACVLWDVPYWDACDEASFWGLGYVSWMMLGFRLVYQVFDRVFWMMVWVLDISFGKYGLKVEAWVLFFLILVRWQGIGLA